MADIKRMNMEELCGYVANHLRNDNIPVVLVGGACVICPLFSNCCNMPFLEFRARGTTR